MSDSPAPIRTTSDTIETLFNRVSVRDFSPQAIDDALLDTLIHAARRTPTSSNTQTYSIVVVRDPDKKRTSRSWPATKNTLRPARYLWRCVPIFRTLSNPRGCTASHSPKTLN